MCWKVPVRIRKDQVQNWGHTARQGARNWDLVQEGRPLGSTAWIPGPGHSAFCPFLVWPAQKRPSERVAFSWDLEQWQPGEALD